MYTARGRHYSISRNNPQQVCQESAGTVRTQNKASSTVNVKVPLITSQGDKVHATPYSVSVQEREPWTGSFQFTSVQPTNNGCAGGGSYCDLSVDAGYLRGDQKIPAEKLDTELMERMRGISETKALADVRRSYNNIPLLVAERRETLQMIGKRARTLTRQGIKAQRDALARWYATAKRNRPQAAKDIASLHLEMLFGWLPIIGEIEGMCDQLARGAQQVITGRGRMADDRRSPLPPYIHPLSEGVLINGVKHQAHYAMLADLIVRHSARTSLRYSIDVEAAQRLRDNGFNPAAVVYDLVPLSFLSEFISNLGTWIRSYDPLIGCTYVTGSTTTWFNAEVRYTILPRNAVDPWKYQISGTGRGSQTARQLLVRRFVHNSPPESSLWLVNNLSLSKAATIVALGLQRGVKPLKKLVAVQPFRYRGPRPKFLPPIQYRP